MKYTLSPVGLWVALGLGAFLLASLEVHGQPTADPPAAKDDATGQAAADTHETQPAPARTEEYGYVTERNVGYRPDLAETDAYAAERCVLDLYYPAARPVVDRKFPTVVWFHGGGLRNGNKWVPQPLKLEGVAVVAVNYRLYPAVKSPVYIEDAAAAVAWTLDHIADYGGDPDAVYVAGHSAGGYLTSMVGLDPRWLEPHGHHPDQLAGLVPYSGHAITHFTVREERGIDGKQPIVDDLAPLYHVRPDAPPLVLITGDRDLELLGRYEENAYLFRMMKVAGHERTELHELDGHNHTEMVAPAHTILKKFIRANEKQRKRIDSELIDEDAR